MDLSKIKSNIRAMLNLAGDSASTPAEKEQAMRRVTKLMDEYNLSEEDLPDADGIIDSLDKMEPGCAKVDVGKKMCVWMSALCVFVERLIGTIRVHSVRVEGGVNCVFYGVEADCQIAAEIFFEVRDYIETAAGTKGYGGTKRGSGYSYCLGFVTGLQEQLKKAQTVTAPVTGNALMVMRNAIVVKKLAVAKRYADRLKLKTSNRTHRSRGRSDEDFAKGVMDGMRHNVNTDRRKKIAN